MTLNAYSQEEYSLYEHNTLATIYLLYWVYITLREEENQTCGLIASSEV
jgi:hypothetical protein